MKNVVSILFVLTLVLTLNETVYAASNDEKQKIIIQYMEDETKYVPEVLINSHSELIKKLDRYNMEIWAVSCDNLDDTFDKLSSDSHIKIAQKDNKIYMDENVLNWNYSMQYSYLESYYKYQWGLENNGQLIIENGIPGIDIKALDAWKITKGSNEIVVGVLDSGIDINNSNIEENIYKNQQEIPDNGVDDDNNGYIDDINGWDFYHDDNTVYDSFDEDSHGTYTAGIISANDDDKGIVGVAPNVKIMPLKFMDTVEGGSSYATIEAIDYAEQMGVDIINCSWSGGGYNPALEAVIESSDMLFVCSAGNKGDNIDYKPVYPACFELSNIISVGAINNRGDISKVSNVGTKVDVLAPGEDIISILPEENFIFASGTSSAAPYVTGIAALAKSISHDITANELVQKIKNTVDQDMEKYPSVMTL